MPEREEKCGHAPKRKSANSSLNKSSKKNGTNPYQVGQG